MEDFNKNSLGTVLQSQMEKRGIRTSDLANSTGLPPATVSRIVIGATDNPTIKTLVTIADFFGVSMDFLLGRTQKTQDQTGIEVQVVDKFYKTVPIIPWAYIKKWVYNKEAFLSAGQSIITDRHLSQEAFALKVDTDSYKKYFSKDSMLIVDKQNEYYSGDYVIVSINRHKPIIQELEEYNGSLYMNSINLNIPSTKICSEHIIYGKVIESRNYY